ncbi:hypothetical protein [Streptomyces bluensis]|uniref:hypothetical protein n=1 Tax=Streptomyces bluensis TaxID=33897 RepID=UPI0033267C1A
MAQNPYVHLGWNPVPGQPGEVENLRTQLTKSATALQTAYQKIDKLLGESSFWEGDAAVGFREALDGDLPKYMKDAHRSLTLAAGHLGTWHGGLTSRRELAHKYDLEAADHKGDLKAANSRHESAKQDPDLKLADQTFTEGPELEAAQARLNAATDRLNDAVTAVNNAQGALDEVMRKARELEGTHQAEARDLATKLKDSTKDLAPEEPGWLSKALSWIGDNLTSILGVLAAVAGLLALLCTGPFGIAFLLAAGALSLATMASRLSDPKVRASLKDGFTKGEFDADFWENSVGLVGDALGAVPGIGAVSRGLNGAVQSTRFASEAVTAGQFLGRFADDTVTAAGRIAASGANPVGDLVVRAAGGSQGLKTALDFASPVAGVGTAGFGLAADNIDALKDGKGATTAVDAGRAGLFDGPAAVGLVGDVVRVFG